MASPNQQLPAEKAIYPKLILPNVYLLGYNSPLSYGGNSWFVVDKQGNWMIDSPRFIPHLVNKIKELGFYCVQVVYN